MRGNLSAKRFPRLIVMNIFAQIISIAAAAFNIISYQMKDNRRLFLCKGISGALFAVNFFMLGNITAGALNAVNLLRGVVLVGSGQFRRTRWLVLVQALYLAGCVFTFGRSEVMFGGAALAMALSLITTASQLAETQILWGRNGKHIRLAQLCFISPIWLFNNVVTGSIGGIITEIFGIVSVVVSVVRYGLDGFEKDKEK